MTIFVTGGCGFIGSNFIRDWFAHHSEPMVNIDKLTYAGNPENLADLPCDVPYTFVRADIGDGDTITQLLDTHKPRAILNFAAESHVDRSIAGPVAFIETNIMGTFTLLECARTYYNALEGQDKDNFRFLHVSTDEVYGSLEPNDPAFAETHPYQPNSPYSASKASSDHLVRAYYHTYSMPVLTTNCSNNYGPYQFPEKLIPLVIQRAWAGENLPIYGTGEQIRDWLYVGDHCSAIRRVLEAGTLGDVYNIGGNSEKTNISVVHTLCDILDKLRPKADGGSYRSQIEHVTDRAGHDQRYAINADKIKQDLGWVPATEFDQGIQKTVQWYLDNPAWVENIITGKYRPTP